MFIKSLLIMTALFSVTKSLNFLANKKGKSLLRTGRTLAMVATSVPKTEVDTSLERLNKLRSEMKKDGIDCIIVPTEDPHMSEYTAPYYYRREYITGFTGSAGTAVITNKEALLFTDGRYHNQAELELSADWKLMKQGLKDVPTPSEWISKSFTAGSIIGIDPLLHAAKAMKKIEDALLPKNIVIKSLLHNPIDKIWEHGRAPIPNGMLRIHPIEYAGKTIENKLKDIRSVMKDNNVRALVSTSLDGLLLNI